MFKQHSFLVVHTNSVFHCHRFKSSKIKEVFQTLPAFKFSEYIGQVWLVKSSVLTLTSQMCNVGLFWNSEIKVKHGIFSASSILVSLCYSSLQILCKAQVVVFSRFLIKTTNCLIFRTFNHMKLGPLTKFDKGNMMAPKNWQWHHVAKFWPHCHFFGLLPIWSNPKADSECMVHNF